MHVEEPEKIRISKGWRLTLEVKWNKTLIVFFWFGILFWRMERRMCMYQFLIFCWFWWNKAVKYMEYDKNLCFEKVQNITAGFKMPLYLPMTK